MFISFLYPFNLRQRMAPYLWVAYKQMGDLGATEVAFIASEAYFQDPEKYRVARRFECQCPENPELAFRVPEAPEVRRFERYQVPMALYNRLKDQCLADSLVWLHLMTEVDENLVAFLCECIAKIGSRREPLAVLTWCNFPSVSLAAQQYGLPIIHCELGPLRDPWYKPLGYLDFQGVNGNTEAEQRFQQWQAQGNAHTPMSPGELFTLFRGPALPERSVEPTFPLGVPLQVEGDSNVLAYGNGFDLFSLMEYAREYFADREILVRPHPAGRIGVGLGDTRVDDSSTSWEFVRKCEQILALNSSVAIEAMLADRPVAVVGESPARFIAGKSLDRMRTASSRELDFLLLNYFVPYRLLFDRDYLAWRLTRPSESAIREYHLRILRGPSA